MTPKEEPSPPLDARILDRHGDKIAELEAALANKGIRISSVESLARNASRGVHEQALLLTQLLSRVSELEEQVARAIRQRPQRVDCGGATHEPRVGGCLGCIWWEGAKPLGSPGYGRCLYFAGQLLPASFRGLDEMRAQDGRWCRCWQGAPQQGEGGDR